MLSPGTWSGRERSSHTGQQQCRGQDSPFSFFLRLRCGGRVRACFKANRAFFVTPPPPSSRMFLHVPSPFERARTHFSIAGIAFPHEFGNPPRPRRGRRGRMRPHSCARPLRATRIPLQGHVRAASRGALRPARRHRLRACLGGERGDGRRAPRGLRALLLQLLHLPHEARPLP